MIRIGDVSIMMWWNYKSKKDVEKIRPHLFIVKVKMEGNK